VTSTPRDDGLWPIWVRHLVLGGLVAIIGTGLVVVVYERGLLPIAGPFVALFVAPFIVGLGLRFYVRRSERAAAAALTALADLIPVLEQDRQLPRGSRATGAADDALDAALTRARTSMSQLSLGDRATAARTLDALRTVSAPWAHADAVADPLARIERSGVAILAEVRRRERHQRGRAAAVRPSKDDQPGEGHR
jgi:hypothetical protein